jgi:hypothetical protein
MATTTPNYGWTVPTSGDLVKDGATAIETLGDAIDASMNTALGTKKAGMVLLNTTSFSAVASQSINDVFSTTYDNYRIIVNANSSSTSSPGQLIRLRASGADNSSSNYRWSNLYIFDSSATPTVTGGGSNGLTTSFYCGSNSSTAGYTGEIVIDISNPFATKNTGILFQSISYDQSGTRGTFETGGGTMSVTTSYTGFTLVPSSVNITGTVSVYGYNK